MITLITGLPGNGKTLYALQYVSEWAKREERQVWYHGIKGLKPELGWHVLPTKVEKVNGRDEAVPQWWMCPANSIILIDEVQNAGFGMRPRGQVPEWGQRLETHRHLGVDLVMITQSPTLLDAHDRALCELHFHVMRTFGMQRAVIHEFRPVRDNVLKSRKGSIEHRWAYPKHVFEWYTSAEAHTHKRRIPMKVVVFLALPFVIGGISWFAWSSYLDPKRFDKSKVPGQPAALGGPVAAVPTGPLTPLQYVAQFQPRVQGLAYTAPVYDKITEPVEAPYPAAVIASAKRCQAYTQQGTRLDMPEALCRELATSGFFVAWKQPVQVVQQPAQEKRATEPSGAFTGWASLGGSPRSHILGGDSNVAGNVDQAPSRAAARALATN